MKAIERAVALTNGSPGELARRISAVKGVHISNQRAWNWLNRDAAFPAEFCIAVEHITIAAVNALKALGEPVPCAPVMRHELRPDVFTEIADTRAA